MNGWPFRELGTLTDAARPITYGVVKPGDAPLENGVTLVRGGDILGGRVASELRTVSLEVSNQYRRTLLQGGELLVSLVGNPGAVAIAPPELAGANLARQVGLVSLRNDVDAQFVMYAMMSPGGRNAIAAMTKGSVQQVINLADLKRLLVPVPPLDIQRRIASILGAYDDLIEVNRQRVAVLEAMARGLFEEWFVRFRFPAHENHKIIDTLNGPLPEGWRIASLSELAAVNARTLRPWLTPDRIGYIDIASVSPGQVDGINWMPFADAPGRARRLVRDGSVIWSNVRPNRRSFALLLEPDKDVVVSTGFAVLDAEGVPYSYLYHAVTTDAFVGYLIGNATGAAYPAVTASTFERAQLLVPDKQRLDTFHSITDPALRLAKNLRQANTSLAAARNLLLPRLISGELSVAAAEHELELAA